MSSSAASLRASYARTVEAGVHQRGDLDVVIRVLGDENSTMRIEWPGCGNALEVLESIASSHGAGGFTTVGFKRLELDNGHRQYAIDWNPDGGGSQLDGISELAAKLPLELPRTKS